LHIFSVFISVAVKNILRNQAESINYEAIGFEYYEHVCIFALVI